jgi:hypothetical protein
MAVDPRNIIHRHFFQALNSHILKSGGQQFEKNDQHRELKNDTHKITVLPFEGETTKNKDEIGQ